ncbi:MAG: hypothetical protein LBT05_15790 [Planctomycetaceae bacterium]|jgi:hypothetical protein|nr:hypothetical protein [Planctomycetaceae bacterium]
MKHIASFIAACAMLLCCGCAKHPATVPVSGEVLYKGQPLKQGRIIFEIDGQRPATGKIADGKIVEVTSYEPNDGVAPGTVKIAVFSLGEEKGYMEADTESLIPEKYNHPKTSGLAATIEKGKKNVIKLTLE